MAIKHICAAGGYDFTSLAAWQTWAATNTDAEETAVIHRAGGADCGNLPNNVTWSNRETRSMIIEGADDSVPNHDPTLDDVAKTLTINYEPTKHPASLTIRRVSVGGFCCNSSFTPVTTCSVMFDRCRVFWQGTVSISTPVTFACQNHNYTIIVKNCLFLAGSLVTGPLINLTSGTNTNNPKVEIRNCTFYDSNGASTQHVVNMSVSATGKLDLVFVNNVVIAEPGYAAQCIKLTVTSGGVLVSHILNNVTSDASGSIINQAASAVFASVINDFRLLSTSPARDAGNNTYWLDIDMNGRPRSGTIDCGAFEYQTASQFEMGALSITGMSGPMAIDVANPSVMSLSFFNPFLD